MGLDGLDVFKDTRLIIGSAVVGDAVEGGGGSEALVVVKDDGWVAPVFGEAGVAQEDAFLTKVARGFVTDVVEGEGVVDADFAGGFEVEEFVVELGVLQEADAGEIETEAVDGFHAQGAVFAGVVGVFDPAGELVVEFFERADVVEVAGEELVAEGAEEAFDFALGGSVAHGGVDEDSAESGADLAELFGGVVGAVVGVDGLGDASFVEGVLEAIDEVFGVVGVVEAGIGDDAGGVVDKGDEEDLLGCGSFGGVGPVEVAEVGSVQGVDLPEFVGVGFGKGETAFRVVGLFAFEEVVFVDGAAEGTRCDLVAAEVALFDAGAVEGLDIEGSVRLFATLAGMGTSKGWQGFFDGGEDVFGGDFAQGAFVGTQI